MRPSFHQTVWQRLNQTPHVDDYEKVRDKLKAEGESKAGSEDDKRAATSLPAGRKIKKRINYTKDNNGSSTPYVAEETLVALTNANAKALAFKTKHDIDGRIAINPEPIKKQGKNWDVDPTTGIEKGTYDLVGVITHEIGHVLGFRSIVDILVEDAVKRDYRKDTFYTPYLPELFRFSDRSKQQGAIDVAADKTVKYFSIDGGRTKIAEMAQGKMPDNGDGFQAEHWTVKKPPTGVMAVGHKEGENVTQTISDVDKQLFDVIGWDL